MAKVIIRGHETQVFTKEASNALNQAQHRWNNVSMRGDQRTVCGTFCFNTKIAFVYLMLVCDLSACWLKTAVILFSETKSNFLFFLTFIGRCGGSCRRAHYRFKHYVMFMLSIFSCSFNHLH